MMALSSVIRTFDPRSTVCGLVRAWERRMARVTPADTAPLTIAAITTIATTALGRRLPAGTSGGDSAPSGSITVAEFYLVGWIVRVPGEDQLAVRGEADILVELDRRVVLGPRPDVAEGDAPLLEELDRGHEQRPPDALPAVALGDV